MTPEQWAWLAGWIEGEGCFILSGRYQLRIQVISTDRDVVERAHEWTQVGHVSGKRKRMPHHKQQWAWIVSDRNGVKDVLEGIWPWLGERRRIRALNLLGHIALREEDQEACRTLLAPQTRTK